MANDKNITGTICNLKSKDDCYSMTLNMSDVYEPRSDAQNIVIGFSFSLLVFSFLIFSYGLYKYWKSE
ncbi:hypothetical protein [Xenorhabdus griffiniae]|uniref:Uncharacterized protein n=1 Tax=Xenorhabdus griffiniae TaxID=351672 RepID=A0ABY9XN20_9GAMM|nr:hypothetical protein [Xenorhabdus griffiniae]MBD1226404.1 hypothetical protein [Xenorhabdus griffiniae]MBE8588723.1 hypothetical protein [Xenorhabdus griffiniae]WMV74346.1 hypothetical protein QL128_10305 [Xenorhabdus griffiniae]WNH04026.1 hypothetical protein QL112_010310 [Xenorhabdus griffiniae]